MSEATEPDQPDTCRARAARADAAIRRALPLCSDEMLAALRGRLAHAEQLRRLGVVPSGQPGANSPQKGN